MAVIGAGIAGVSTALALDGRGISNLVIERGAVASGASGRNAGFLMRGAADNYAAAVADWGRERARLIWRWSEENLHRLREFGIDRLTTTRRVPSCLLALDDEEEEELKNSVALLREDGFRVEWISRGEDAAWKSGRARGGLVNPDDGACNPHDVLTMLAGMLRTAPLLHEEVAGIERTRNGLRLVLPEADVYCSRAILCTNAYSPVLLPGLDGMIDPKRAQMLAFESAGRRLDHSYYANHGYDYFRQPSPETFVIGGRRSYFSEVEVGYDDRTTVEVQGALESLARGLFGDPVRVTARWSGVMGFSPDGLPLIGPVDDDRRLWLCSACTGHGMSLSCRAADQAVRCMIDGVESPFPLTRIEGFSGVDLGGPSHN